MSRMLETMAERLAFTKRHGDGVRRIVAILPKLAKGKAKRFTKTPLYPLAREVLELVGDEGLG